MSPLASLAGPETAAARLIEARGARPLAPAAEIEEPQRRRGGAGERSTPIDETARRRAVPALRVAARRLDNDTFDDRAQGAVRHAAARVGFTAQFIAQELLSDGLYHENFRPAVAAYSAADSNFESVRRPPRATVEIWA